ncbi:MAG TPA: 2-C-methyl-D-erythritol 2,4-cyclodiphosphate synthase [bacterium]|nr:2-C-methyl-D-erythritol 2,4-cyclodiphosphate synthase [bacterium]
MRIGQGFDAHRLVAGRKLVLCGVTVPFEQGLLGHSDADVAAHAVMDAVLGALALGDIGAHFPPGDPRYQDADSMGLLREVAALARGRGFEIGQIDVTILAEAPKLAPYIDAMREKLAAAAGAPLSRVSVKATTTEGMGFTGRGEGMAAMAVAVLEKE